MTRRSSFWFAVVVVLSSILLSVAMLILVAGLKDADAQRVASVSAALAAIGSFLALLVLVVYTRETFLLRSAAEQQLEAAIQPVVLIDISTEDGELGQPPHLREVVLRNIGVGPAFSVSVDPIRGADWNLETPAVPLIEASKTHSICDVVAAHADGSGRGGDAVPQIAQAIERRGGSFALVLIDDAISKGRFPADSNIVIEFRSLSGNRYRVLQRITEMAPMRFRTDFVKLELLGKQSGHAA